MLPFVYFQVIYVGKRFIASSTYEALIFVMLMHPEVQFEASLYYLFKAYWTLLTRQALPSTLNFIIIRFLNQIENQYYFSRCWEARAQPGFC